MSDIKPFVVLTPEEFKRAVFCGHERTRKARLAGRRDQHTGEGGTEGQDDDVLGALGELAFAKAAGIEPTLSTDPDKRSGDVGGVHVRATRYPEGGLALRAGEDVTLADEILALVTYHGEWEFHIPGWAFGYDIHYWRDDWRSPTWCLPQSLLRPLAFLTVNGSTITLNATTKKKEP